MAGFSLLHPPPNHTVNWTATSNLTIISQGSTSAIVRWTGSNNGAATLTANIQNINSIVCPVSSPFTLSMQAGPFASGQVTVSGTAAVCPDTEYWYEAKVFGGHQSGCGHIKQGINLE